jgi:hypothetical protein
MIDWRDLLVRYMAHVDREEGSTFVYAAKWSKLFTPEEVAILEQINEEADKVEVPRS